MQSKWHLAVSTGLGVVVAVSVGASPGHAVSLVGFSAALGTAIDVDHFVIARLRTGDWASLWFALSHPRAAVLEQDRIFREGDVGALTRLLSHALVGGAVVAVVAALDPFLALVSGVVVYVHVVSDLFYDVFHATRASQSS